MTKNEQLIAAREIRGWTQTDAADAIGISRSHYARLELGQCTPHGSTRRLICKAFNLPAEALGLSKSSRTTLGRGLCQQSPAPAPLPPTPSAPHAVALVRVSVRSLVLVCQQLGWTTDELLAQVQLEVRRGTTMTPPSRREMLTHALSVVAGLPLAVCGASGSVGSLSPEETVPLYLSALPAAWRLYFEGQITELEELVPAYIGHLSTLAQQPSRSQTTARSLLSQAHALHSLVVLEHEDYGASLRHGKQALLYGQMADDPDLQLGAYIRQANTLYYQKRWSLILQVYEEALQTVNIERASPLIKARVYNSYGTWLSHFGGREQEALRYQALAHEVFPSEYEQDPSYPYIHETPYILPLNDAMMNLSLGHAQQARDAIEQAARYVPQAASPTGIELLNHQAIIAIAQNELEESCQYIEEVMLHSQALGSDLYTSHARRIMARMPAQWMQERRVKQLAERLDQQ